MNEFTKRLIKLADQFRVSSPAAFAKKTGISHQSATNYLKGIRMPTLDVLLKIQESFENLNIEWLINGNGEILKGDGNNIPDQVKDMEIHYLKKSNEDKDQTIQSQKALILVLSEKAGIDLSDIPVSDAPINDKKGRIKGFGGFYAGNFRMLIRGMKVNYQ